jgi:hypothetical protein
MRIIVDSKNIFIVFRRHYHAIVMYGEKTCTWAMADTRTLMTEEINSLISIKGKTKRE